jgi:hypothetical protein
MGGWVILRDGYIYMHAYIQTYTYIKIKGKAVPLHDMKAPGGRGGIAQTHSQPRH